MSKEKLDLRLSKLFCTIIAVLIIQPHSIGASIAEEGFVIINARVFDGERLIPKASVVVKGGEIFHIGEYDSDQSSFPVIDGEGKTILPGLIDAHVHLANVGLKGLREAAKFGVTTVLEMFTNATRMKMIHDSAIRLSSPDFADYYSSGVGATVAGGHGAGPMIPLISKAEDADSFVAARVGEGSDYIKIILEPGTRRNPRPTIDKPTLEALIKSAHLNGKLAVVHIRSAENARMVIKSGADGLAHIWRGSGKERSLSALAADRGVFVIPTLSVMGTGINTPDNIALINDIRLKPYLTSEAVSWLSGSMQMPKRRFNMNKNFNMSRMESIMLSDAKKAVYGLKQAKVRILAGTDAGNPGVWHGISLHRELALLVDAGLTPMEALTAATSAPADSFGLKDRGRIKPGMRADMVLVNGDPTADILLTRDIDSIWIKGQKVER